MSGQVFPIETDLREVYFLPDSLAPEIKALKERRATARADIVRACPDCQWVRGHIMREHVHRSADLGYEIIRARKALYNGTMTKAGVKAVEQQVATERATFYWARPIVARCPRHTGWDEG